MGGEDCASSYVSGDKVQGFCVRVRVVRHHLVKVFSSSIWLTIRALNRIISFCFCVCMCVCVSEPYPKVISHSEHMEHFNTHTHREL